MSHAHGRDADGHTGADERGRDTGGGIRDTLRDHDPRRNRDPHDTHDTRDVGDSRDHDTRRDHDVRGDHDARRDHDARGDHDARRDADVLAVDRRSVVAREKESYGGVKIGSAFFGWLTATGTAVLLTALVAAGGAAVGLGVLGDVDDAVRGAGDNADTIGLAGGIALLVILFIAYYCGGYVAGRMARFNGLKQGLAVWLWAIVIAIVVAVGAAIAGAEFDVLARVNGFPRLPINEGDLTTAGVVTAVLVAAASLVGALLGGLAGMRFHRNVDKAGLPATV